jgi:hypothetical protein
MEKIKKLNVFAFAKFQALLATLVGVLAGVIYAFGGFIIDTLVTLGWMTSSETPGLSYGTVLAFGALVGMPFIGGVVGFFTGVLQAVLFNIAAKCLGGFTIPFLQKGDTIQ